MNIYKRNGENRDKIHVLTCDQELKQGGEAENKDQKSHDKCEINGERLLYIIIQQNTIIEPNYK